MEKITLIICGACGKMGQTVMKLALKDNNFLIKGGIEVKGHEMIGKKIEGIPIYNDLSEILEKGDVVIDFTTPSATIDFIKKVEEKMGKIVIGTTGFEKNQMEKIMLLGETTSVFFSPNMSLGVNLFFEIIKYAVKLLKNYEIEIKEIHHHFKKDAPSGTAKKIAEIICNEKNWKIDNVLKYGRSGFTDIRKFEEIGIHSLRIGDIVGEHYVYFGGLGEIIEISHRCYNRESFASGALKAAKFISKKEKGFYSMEDLIKEEVLNV
ncbi:MAG: 4-hydroxy-tetrahydrodipicolinate reductase [Candidatus Omnitrophica bacterium]|nr:4-hydroxy-tetrahydrodipicolinate reductase [Candidatus Omnitrophota bacterium]MCM8806953.1 4-hydroxy-tetrahydrodipicolinate reductase [Candidatus Omnitrophota bacterium]